MLITSRALSSDAITQAEADLLEDWIDASIDAGVAVTVPECLNYIYEKCLLCNESVESEMQ